MEYKPLVKKLVGVTCGHRRLIRQAATQAGLYYGQPPMLEYIESHKNCSQTALAQALDISPASVATSLRRLEKAGYVRRTPDKTDSRKNRLALTKVGADALHRFHDCCVDIDRAMFGGFSDADCEALTALLDRMTQNLAAGETEGCDRV